MLSGTHSERPRNIFSPHCSLKAGLGWANKLMMKAVKSQIPGFISGLNNDELGIKISEEIRDMVHYTKDLKTIVFDGSSHDSH